MSIRPAFATNAYLEAYLAAGVVADYYETIRRGRDALDLQIRADTIRRPLWRRYAYAIPSGVALELLARYQPILEIGAGTGYWAKLLRDGGVEVAAYDKFAIGKNEYFDTDAPVWTEVLPGSDNVCRKFPGHTLFLSAPPPGHPFALNCLNQFRGRHVAVIGDASYCATVEFFQKLNDRWEFVEEVALPRWPGYDDSLTIYRRR